MTNHLIHDALGRAEVAKRYYAQKGIFLGNEPARKKFLQDRRIDLQLLRTIIRQIFKEQLTIIDEHETISSGTK